MPAFVYIIFLLMFSASICLADQVFQTDLPNGLTLLTLEDHSAPLVAVRILYHVGNKNEQAGLTGITRICEKIMGEGTPTYKKGEYSRIVQAGGGWSCSHTYLDITDFMTRVPSSMLDTVLFLEADRMQNIEPTYERLLLAKDALKKDRLQHVESFIYGHINEEFFNLSYRAHPYRNPMFGWPADIDNISLDDLKDYFRLYFQPANATIVVVGDFNTRQVNSKVQELFGDIISSPVPERRKIVEPAQAGERYGYLEGYSGVPAFIIGYHIPEISHEDIPVLKVISSVLTGGESSRINKRMVADEKSALVVAGELMETEDPGMIVCWAILNYDCPVSSAEAQMNEEIVRLRSEYITGLELEKAKNRIEADYYRQIGALDKRALMVGFYHIVTGDWKAIEDIVEKTRAVSKEDIMSVAQKYFKKSNRTVVFLEPVEASETGKMD